MPGLERTNDLGRPDFDFSRTFRIDVLFSVSRSAFGWVNPILA